MALPTRRGKFPPAPHKPQLDVEVPAEEFSKHDHLVQTMIRLGIPLTLRNYLDVDRVPLESVDAEYEMPRPFAKLFWGGEDD